MADQLGGASGNATASDLLTGYTASTANGIINGAIPIVAGGNTITPTTALQTAIGAAKYATNAINVAGDANLVPSNIANGKTIFNVVGTALLATGNATAADLLSGYTASTGSGSITGTMPNNGAFNGQPGQSGGAGYYTSVSATSPTPGSQTFTSSGTFTVPSGVTRVLVELWGGGGGGGGGDGSSGAGGGGGGGAYTAAWVDVTPGNGMAVTIGAGGAVGATGSQGVGATNGSNGGNTSFAGIVANGGSGGLDIYNGGGGGAGGSATSSVPSGTLVLVAWGGGYGGTNDTSWSGGGGGSAGGGGNGGMGGIASGNSSTGNGTGGGNAGSGGAGTPSLSAGGVGGVGAYFGQASSGLPGVGGGGGGGVGASTNPASFNGGNGKAIIHW